MGQTQKIYTVFCSAIIAVTVANKEE